MKKVNVFVVKVPTNRTKVVAVRSVSDSTVLAHGTKASSVAKKVSGFKPVIMHVPQQGKRYVY
jgi:hypothetical protein